MCSYLQQKEDQDVVFNELRKEYRAFGQSRCVDPLDDRTVSTILELFKVFRREGLMAGSLVYTLSLVES